MRGLRVLAAAACLLLLPAMCQAGIGTELNGLGSFGVSLGVMRWFADSDAAKYNGQAAQVRPIGKAIFRYRVNTDWLVSIETGYGWNSYPGSGDVVTSVIPTTFGIEKRVGELGGATASVAAGAGFYVWARRQGGTFLKDPETAHDLHAIDPGVYIGGTGEFHMSRHVTCAIQTSLHYILNVNGDNFPTVLGGDDVFMDVRAGFNYYFSPSEGLIWKPKSEGGAGETGGTQPQGAGEEE
jgi:hypothetical protein